MKIKNTLIALLAMFSLICFWHLYNTYQSFSMENEYFSLPDSSRSSLEMDENFQSDWKYSRERSFTLGLDLQGGMYATLEISVEDLIRGLAGNPDDAAFNEAIVTARQNKVNSQSSFVDLFVQALREKNPSVKLATYFSSQTSGINYNTPDDEVIEYLSKSANDAIDQTFDNIRKRIDQFGVTSPNLQKLPGGRILVELPGAKDAERIEKLLVSTAKLEFYETYTVAEAFPLIDSANNILKVIKGLVVVDTTANDTVASDKDPKKDSTSVVKNDTMKKDTSLAGNDTSLSGQDSLSKDEQIEKFKKENPLYAKLLPPNFEGMDPSQPVVGYALVSDTASVNEMLAMPEIARIFPREMKFFWTNKPTVNNLVTLVAIKVPADGKSKIDGSHISNAKQDFEDERGTGAIVSMVMTPEGATIWRQMTGANKGKCIAIVMDNLVYSFPVVQNEIPNGRSQISGNFTIDEAKDLSTLLNAGKLPTRPRLEGKEIVGPTLGADNINKGLMSFFVALAVTIMFMMWYYSGAGVISAIALMVNLIFLLGVTAAFQTVLTLPGIAAIVLTIGMAVDGNVLIYERVREEMLGGRNLKSAVGEGFSNAFSSIVDGNLTTLLTGIVLFAFGVGPIRGFAVSLIIGIVTTLIAVLLVTRMIMETWSRKPESKLSFGNNFTSNLFKNIKLKMTQRKKMLYTFSGVLTILSLVSIFTVGFKTGVDFDGGYQYIVKFEQPVDVETMRGSLTKAFENNAPIIKTIGGDHRVMVTTSYLVDDPSRASEVEKKMMDALNSSFSSAKPFIEKNTVVGPSVASDIKRAAIYSVLFSLLIIFVYILIRFRKWQYSLGGIASLAHDVIITLGIFSFLGWLDILPFSMEIDQAFIAAILTIIGYSINDTVIVFDRVRENYREMKHASHGEIFDLSMDQTFSRTIITSGTTILTALILFLMGGDVIKGFVFALLVGIGFGTYSSVFIASPIALDLIEREEEAKKEPAKA